MSTFSWGCDVSTTRTAIAVIENGTGRFHQFTRDWPPSGGSLARLASTIAFGVEDWARELAELYPPATIAVEIPQGRVVNQPLTGSFFAAMVGLDAGTGVEPWHISSSAWKKAALGHGIASKPAVLQWARAAGSQDWCVCQGDGSRPVHERCDRKVAAHDRADALGVAEAARRVFLPGVVVPLPLRPFVRAVRGQVEAA